MSASPSTVLEARGLSSGYGRMPVLTDVSFDLGASEIQAVIGHNGSGKSTLLKTLVGIVRPSLGQLVLDGHRMHPTPLAMLRSGVVYLPQGGPVFESMTVADNILVVGGEMVPVTTMEEALQTLESLGVSRKAWAGNLSGGQRQQLCISRALMFSPRVLLLDEPCLGLAEPTVTEVLANLAHLNRNTGVSLLVVEHRIRELLRIAARALVLRNGRVSYFGNAEALSEPSTLKAVYL